MKRKSVSASSFKCKQPSSDLTLEEPLSKDIDSGHRGIVEPENPNKQLEDGHSYSPIGVKELSSDSEIDLSDFKLKKLTKKRKKGIIYISNIPKHMNVTKIREILGEFGKIGRVYLQPAKQPKKDDNKKTKRNKKHRALHFTEGWVEFESKRVAKQIVPLLNNKQISARKKSQFFDYLWTMKYLPRFKWTHLTERMNYEQAVQKQRLMTEVSQARKEKNFFQSNLDKSEFLKNKEKHSHKVKEKPNHNNIAK